MTAVKSKSEKSFFLTHFRNKIGENKRLLIINIVLQLIGLPLMLFIAMYSEYCFERDMPEPDESLMIVSAFAMMICVFSGMLIARNAFSYLYTKTLVDMNYSLPLTARQKFFCEYLSGLAVYLVPAFLSGILSLLMLVMGEHILEVEFDWSLMPDLLKTGVVILFGLILYYTLTVFSLVCTGSPFESVFGTFALNILIPAVFSCVSVIMNESAGFGFDDASPLENTLFTATSPIGMACYIVMYMDSVDYGYGESFANYGYLRWLMFSAIVLAGFIAASYFLYKRRKAESVSKPYVYPLFNHLIMAVGIFCILSLFIVYDTAVMTGVVICAIVYFILEIITRRGFKRFWVSILKFAGMVALVFGVCNVCISTEGFGAGKRVPSAAMVDSVTLDIYGSEPLYLYDNVVFRDKDVIEETVRAHEEIVGRFYNPDDYEAAKSDNNYLSDDVIYDNADIRITYYLKSGTSVSRYYPASLDSISGLVESVMLSEEYAQYRKYQLIEKVINYNEDEYYSTDKKTLEEIENKRSALSVINPLGQDGITCTMKNKEVYRIAEEYAEDMASMTKEELSDSPIYGYLFDMDFPVRECFEDTIALIEEYGIEPLEISAETIEQDTMIVEINDDFTLRHVVAEPGEKDWDEVEYCYYENNRYTSCSMKTYSSDSGYVLNENMLPLVEQLIENASPVVIDSEISGIVYIGVRFDYGCSFILEKSEENDRLIKQFREAINDSYYIAEDFDYDYDDVYE